MTRQEYNLKIYNIIFLELYPKYQMIQDDVYIYIIKCPQQRFGQIICNYICPDYRNGHPSIFTIQFMNAIFPNNPDPFFEESKETYERLVKNEI